MIRITISAYIKLYILEIICIAEFVKNTNNHIQMQNYENEVL